MARLHDYYKDIVIKEMMCKFSYASVMQVPRVIKNHLEYGSWRGCF